MNRERQIDNDVPISMRHAIEQCRQSLDVEIAGVKATAARRKDVQSARVTADESAQQLVVKTFRRRDDLVKLKLGRDVAIVANMAGLEIKIDERDLGACRRLVLDQMDGGFDGERGIADSPALGTNETATGDGSATSSLAGALTRPTMSRISCGAPTSATQSAFPD
jgi:hypothetical protein